MILLDTDHLSVLQFRDHPRCLALLKRLEGSADPSIATTIISFEEQMRGWLAEINRRRHIHDQLPIYARLNELVDFFKRWTLLPLDSPAADHFQRLKKDRVRIGTQDMKVASIALA